MSNAINILTLLAVCGFAIAQTTKLYGNPDGIVFPDAISARSAQPIVPSRAKSTSNRLSIRLAKTINSVSSVEDFLKLVKGVPKEQHAILVHSRFGGEERTNSIQPTPAHCMPELQAVPLQPALPDPSVVYYPSCTRINRCGGCCDHPLLSCQPTKSVTKNFEVLVSKIDADGIINYSGKEIIPLEEHTDCECDCSVKAEHCTGKQEYIEDECMCRCSNVDEEEKCRRSAQTKLWDPTLCACRCRDERECSSGFYFDSISCRCQQQRWYNTQRASGYDVLGTSNSRVSQPPFIVPFGSDSRRRQNKDDPEYK